MSPLTHHVLVNRERTKDFEVAMHAHRPCCFVRGEGDLAWWAEGSADERPGDDYQGAMRDVCVRCTRTPGMLSSSSPSIPVTWRRSLETEGRIRD